MLENHSDDPALRFVGAFRGVAGIEAMILSAYEQFETLEEDFGRWYESGGRVAAMRQDVLRARATNQVFKNWILHEYDVRGGVIVRIDNYIDSLAWSRSLAFAAPT